VDRFTAAEIINDGQTIVITYSRQYAPESTYYVWKDPIGLGHIDVDTARAHLTVTRVPKCPQCFANHERGEPHPVSDRVLGMLKDSPDLE
jgi:hypothetical protein